MKKVLIKGRSVCVVDDDPNYRAFLSVLLSGLDARVQEAASGAELFALLEQQAVDCVLLDYNLKTENGLSVLDAMVSKFEHPPPVVMLTGAESQRTIIKAFRCGVSDYVMKRSLQPEELLKAITRAIARQDDDKAQRGELARLQQRSRLDHATGLYNFAFVEERLAAVAGAPDRPFAIILIAFNEFSLVADRFGGVAADAALRAFAKRLREAGRRVDVCGRCGPATFVYVIETSADVETVDAVAQRLRDTLSFTLHLEEASLDATATIGTAMRGPDGDTADTVLAAADAALAHAARQGVGPNSGAPTRDAASAENATALQRTGNRRREQRQRALKQARIVSRDPFLSLSCTVRDQSSRGARVRIETLLEVPRHFELLFVTSSERRRARKIWQNGKEIGVEFEAANA
jgi:diguanylate cyclase (GGDEF)-like protein